MTDRAAPKVKKPAKEKEVVVPGPKLVDGRVKPLAVIGHNAPPLTGEKNPEAVKLIDELMGYQVQKKSIAKSERDVRNRLKTEFGVLATSVAREIALRKLDADVRVQVETNHEDFKKMLGYQPTLDFVNGVATTASQKAAAPERNTEPSRTPQIIKELEDDAEDEAASIGGVITREG